MRSGVERRLKLSVVVLVFLGYFGLTTTFQYGQVLLLIPVLAVGFMPIGERLDRGFRWYRQITSLAILVFILSIPIIIQVYDPLDAVVSVVMFAQIYSLIHTKRERDYGHIILLSFFLVLAASVLSPQPGIGLVYLLFVAFGVGALSLLEMFSSLRISEGQQGNSVRFEDSTGRPAASELRRPIDFRVVSIMLLAALVILGFTPVLFIVTPRTEAGFLGLSQESPQVTTGLAPEVDLTLAGILSSNAAPVMRVEFPDEPGGRYDAPKLWRSTALDTYTGRSWKRRGLVTRASPKILSVRRFKSDHRFASLEGVNRPSFEVGRVVYHQIFMDRAPKSGVPALQMVKTIIAGEANRRLQFRWDEEGDFTVNMGGSLEKGISLRVWSEVVDPDPDLLRGSSTDYRARMAPSDLRNLTYENLLPRTLEVVEDLTKDAPTAYDKVMAVHDWLRYSGEFVYSKDIPPLPSENPVDAFIVQVKSGHCELYASALALMVRSLGIPARVVSGYRGGLWDENDRSYTVTNDMAHLWAEIYFPDAGWIAFDPSPPQESPALFSLDTLARSYSRYVLKAKLLWFSNVVSYSPDDDNLIFRDTLFRAVRSLSGVAEVFSASDSKGTVLTRLRSLILAAVVLVGVALAVSYVSRRTRRRRRGARGVLTPDQHRALEVHGLMTRRLRRLGLDCRGMTAEEIGEEVPQIRLSDPASALEVLAAYSASRFGRRELSLTRFKDLRRIVRGLKVIAQ